MYGSAAGSHRRSEPMPMIRRNGFSLVELLVAIVIILVIVAIAIPSLQAAKIAANEASATGSLRAIHAAEVEYAQIYRIGFANNLTVLGGSLPCTTASAAAACLLDPSLSGGLKSGYTLAAVGNAAVNGIVNSYAAYAAPSAIGQTGENAFCIDESGILRYDSAGTMQPTTDTACEAYPALQ